MRTAALCSLSIALVACASHVPKHALDRCNLGRGDPNESYAATQGSACAIVATGYLEDEKQEEALLYARKSCELQDPQGCIKYLSYATTMVGVPRHEVETARRIGERACAGGVLLDAGVDRTPQICARLGALYLEVEPKSPRDAAQAYARGCKLGEKSACGYGKRLGFEVDEKKPPPPASAIASAPAPPRPSAVPSAAPSMVASVAPTVSAPPPPRLRPCHDMRGCVTLEVAKRNVTEIFGTLTSKCTTKVQCGFCPANGGTVNPKGECRSVTLAPGESKSGQAHGLWYDGKGDGLAYDCADADDDRSCRSL